MKVYLRSNIPGGLRKRMVAGTVALVLPISNVMSEVV